MRCGGAFICATVIMLSWDSISPMSGEVRSHVGCANSFIVCPPFANKNGGH